MKDEYLKQSLQTVVGRKFIKLSQNFQYNQYIKILRVNYLEEIKNSLPDIDWDNDSVIASFVYCDSPAKMSFMLISEEFFRTYKIQGGLNDR